MLRHVGLRLLAVALACALCGAAPRARAGAGDVVVIRGEVVRDTVLKRKRTYLLQGFVTVRAGATLRIRPGTTVYCDVGATLVVERGAKLRAEGTAELPIVFTSAQPEAERRRGDWGGIVVNGRAPVAAPGGTAEGEGATGAFGGYEVDDSSGALHFLRASFPGVARLFPLICGPSF